MHIAYSITSYFIVLALWISACVPCCLLRPIRKRMSKIFRDYHVLQNQLVITTMYFSLAVLITLLLDGLWAWYSLVKSVSFTISQGGKSLTIDQYQQFDNVETFRSLYRTHQDLFVAIRNLDTAFFAIFVSFALWKFIGAINELGSLDHQQVADALDDGKADGGMNPQSQQQVSAYGKNGYDNEDKLQSIQGELTSTPQSHETDKPASPLKAKTNLGRVSDQLSCKENNSEATNKADMGTDS